MGNFAVIKETKSLSQPFLLYTNRECLKALEKADYKVRFEVSNGKAKAFYLAKPNYDLDPVDDVNKLLKEMKIDGTSRTVEPST